MTTQDSHGVPQLPAPGQPEPKPTTDESAVSKAFPVIMKYSGLAIAMYEGLIERPPSSYAIGLALVMMAGAPVLERIITKKYGG